MTTEGGAGGTGSNKGENKTPSLDVDALADKINQGLKETFAPTAQSLSDVSNKLDALKPESKENPDDNPDDGLEDDDFASKKDIKDLVAKEMKTVNKTIKDTILETNNVATKKQTYDQKAFDDFPMLKQGSPLYSSEFMNEVQKEMKERVKEGDSNENPRLVYDSAASVYARNPKMQKLNRDYVEEKNRELNNRDGSFDFNNKNPKQTQGPRQSQLDLAVKLGMDPEKVKERLKKNK